MPANQCPLLVLSAACMVLALSMKSRRSILIEMDGIYNDLHKFDVTDVEPPFNRNFERVSTLS